MDHSVSDTAVQAIVRTVSWLVRRIPSSRTVKPFFVRRSLALSRHRFAFAFQSRIPGVRWSAEAFPDLLARHMLFEGTYQEDVILALQHLAREGDVVFDVGGHHGLMSIVSALAVGPRGRVVTFEPNPHAREQMARHLQLNAVGNVKVEALALSDHRGELPFFIQAGTASWNSSLFRDFISRSYGVEQITVPTETLDGYVARTGLVPRAIKIDVEGSEFLVLRGARETIAKHRPALVMEFNPEAARAADTTISAITKFLLEMDYRLIVLKRGRLARYRFDRQEPFDETRHCHDDLANVICMPPMPGGTDPR